MMLENIEARTAVQGAQQQKSFRSRPVLQPSKQTFPANVGTRAIAIYGESRYDPYVEPYVHPAHEPNKVSFDGGSSQESMIMGCF